MNDSTTSLPPTSNSLTIRLAEAAVTLRPSPVSSVEVTPEGDAQPGMLRGLLILDLVKATKINYIDVSLIGKSVVRLYERVGTRAVEQLETNVFFEASSTLYSEESKLQMGAFSPISRHSPSSSDSSNPPSPPPRTPDTPLVDGSPIIVSPADEGVRRRSSVKNGFASLFRPTHKAESGRFRGNSISNLGKTRPKDDNVNDSSKLFRAGTYTYPISFVIPADAPPSMECTYGKVSWVSKATIHRPGTFTSKFTAKRTIRQSKRIGKISSVTPSLSTIEKVFIGGTIPVSFTLVPLDKVKIFEIAAIIEEKTHYLNKNQALSREETRFITLMSIGCPDRSPILPLPSHSIDFFKTSSLCSAFYPQPKTDDEIEETAVGLMGLGPWNISTRLQIPDDCGKIQKSTSVKQGSIVVSHRLKFMLRVQRPNEEIDIRTGKPKQFTITVNTPLEILSCRCNPAWAGLPPYSESFSASLADRNTDLCPCTILHDQRRIHSRGGNEDTLCASPQPTVDENENTVVPLDETVRLIFRDTAQYQRLVSGQESAVGLPPPSYYDATELRV
ncbi:hypothetical protein DL96DRAFT_1709123 [Flagelloscypha sp. PMI_526]|nr:hypothetical protein DL96DRAFT_1709123 [Flagelloscypha sp. PMI_526]